MLPSFFVKTGFETSSIKIQIYSKFDVGKTGPSGSIFTESSLYFQKPTSKYDAIYVVEPNTTNSFFLDISSNDYAQTDRFIIKPSDADITKDSCSVSHKGTLYFYGGSNHPNKIFKFSCDNSIMPSRLKEATHRIISRKMALSL